MGNAIKRFIAEWYFGEVNNILITFVASIAIGVGTQIIKYGFGYAIITEEDALIISNRIFNILTIPPVLSSVVSGINAFIKWLKQLCN